MGIILYLLYFTFPITNVLPKVKLEIKPSSYLEINSDINSDFHNWSPLIAIIAIRVSVPFLSNSYMVGVSTSYFIFIFPILVISIGMLVLYDSFYWPTVGWDGSGAVSSCPIISHINNIRTNNGISTLLQNRFGDPSFLVFLFRVPDIIGCNSKLSLILLLGCVVKSAQLPPNSWLLAAIRAPTPIPPPVHPPTSVVAGVHVVSKFNLILADLKILLIFRRPSTTFRFPGLTGETDIKKLTAYPTMNHVGTTLSLTRLRLPKIAPLHLNAHALLKSPTFMSFGYATISSPHGQDKRLIRTFFLAPLSKLIFFLPSIILAGLPMLGASFLKDLIADAPFSNLNLVPILLLLANLRLSSHYVIKTPPSKHSPSPPALVNRSGGTRVAGGLLLLILVINFFTNELIMFKHEIPNYKFLAYSFTSLFPTMVVLKLKSYFESPDKSDSKRNRSGVRITDTLAGVAMWKNPRKSPVILNRRVSVSVLILACQPSPKCNLEEAEKLQYFLGCEARTTSVNKV